MKILSIGDVQGKSLWKAVIPEVTSGTVDKVVFVGDYPDDDYISDDHIYNNLVEIIEFKKAYPDKVVLLLGNHDLHYFNIGITISTRYNKRLAYKLHRLFIENYDLFDLMYQTKNCLWSHAGLNIKWFNQYKDIYYSEVLPDLSNIAEVFNKLYHDHNYKQMIPMFDVGFIRGGDNGFGGIFWADSTEYADPIDETLPNGIHQVIGHNRVKNITTVYNSTNNGSITFIDVQDRFALVDPFFSFDKIFYKIDDLVLDK